MYSQNLLFTSVFIIKIHYNCRSTDDQISQDTEYIRPLPQDQKSHKGRKQNLRIIKNRKFFCRSIIIGLRHKNLTACTSKSSCYHSCRLPPFHRGKISDNKWQRYQTGKSGEKHDHQFTIHAPFSQNAHIGIGCTGSRTSKHADQGSRICHISCGFDDKQCSNKSYYNGNPLKQCQSFF